MESKTKITAEVGKQEIVINRNFELPVELLFKAYEESGIIEQWMGTKVLHLEPKTNGSYLFETTDPHGNKHRFRGVIHEFQKNERIIRTFEMESNGFGVQLEIYAFEKLTENTSRLRQQMIYQSVTLRDENLKLPFAQGINWAHNRLEEIISRRK
ncbi:SRPBCC domain-containing protein [Robertkochia solimangrovi]|uniref:SRPBCC domain-containing protein n=1 Tax=Robertkochia solimangrovi TaxID=2213046 RepID=UPI00118094BE|nr:SRPBCC domain-containing protein [Robertkochia solimangrovi]TRZ41967.1 ATPase [Robertkochia solimangrovi]